MPNTTMSLKDQREFIVIAKTAKSFDEVVTHTGRSPAALRKLALRLGVRLPEQIATDAQLLAAIGRKPRKRRLSVEVITNPRKRSKVR